MTIAWHTRLEAAREAAAQTERPILIALTAPG